MVWLAEKPSLRAASCCSVEVVNGGGGFLEKGLVSTEETVNRPASTTAFAASASPGLPMVSRSIFLPSSCARRAVKLCPSLSKAAVIDQYSCGRKISISRSRSTTSRSATDCTRHADLKPGSLRQRMGESVKPTKESSACRAL